MTVWVLLFVVLGFLAGVLFTLWTDLGGRRADRAMRVMADYLFDQAERRMDVVYRRHLT
jgi:hypothetical protein